MSKLEGGFVNDLRFIRDLGNESIHALAPVSESELQDALSTTQKLLTRLYGQGGESETLRVHTGPHQSGREPRACENLPTDIVDVYENVVSAANHDLLFLGFAGVRGLVETVCGVLEPVGSFDRQIRAVEQRFHFPLWNTPLTDIVERANRVVHGAQPDRSELEWALDAIDELLEFAQDEKRKPS